MCRMSLNEGTNMFKRTGEGFHLVAATAAIDQSAKRTRHRTFNFHHHRLDNEQSIQLRMVVADNLTAPTSAVANIANTTPRRDDQIVNDKNMCLTP